MARYNLRPRNPSGFVSCGQNYSSIHLRLLSPELRNMIFTYSLLQTDGGTPALLVALRQDKELYRQALEVFYAINELEISSKGELGWFDRLGQKAKEMVKLVVVIIQQVFSLSQCPKLFGDIQNSGLSLYQQEVGQSS